MHKYKTCPAVLQTCHELEHNSDKGEVKVNEITPLFPQEQQEVSAPR